MDVVSDSDGCIVVMVLQAGDPDGDDHLAGCFCKILSPGKCPRLHRANRFIFSFFMRTAILDTCLPAHFLRYSTMFVFVLWGVFMRLSAVDIADYETVGTGVST